MPQGPKIQPMGGAMPEEFARGQGSGTAMKFRAIDADRQKRGLAKLPKPDSIADQVTLDKAMAKMDQDPAYGDRLVRDVLEGRRGVIEDWENHILALMEIESRFEYDKATREALQAYEDSKQYPNRLEAMRDAEVRVNEWSNRMTEIERASRQSGFARGRALRALQVVINDDMTLGAMERQMRMDRGGKPITRDERARLQKLADDYKRKSDEQDLLLQKYEELKAEEAMTAIRVPEKVAPLDPRVKAVLDKIVAGFEERAKGAKARMRERMGRTSAGIDPTVLLDMTEIAAEAIVKGLRDFVVWSDRMRKEFGAWIEPYLKPAFDKANAENIPNNLKAFDPDVQEAVRSGGSKGKRAPKQMDVDTAKEFYGERIGQKVKDKKLDAVSFYLQKLARVFYEQGGITKRDDMVQALWDVMKGIDPNITRTAVIDAWSGYGDYKPPSKNVTTVALQGMKGELQQQRKLQDMAEGKAPLRSGVGRPIPTDEGRRLQQQVHEAKKRGGYTVTDPERQLRSAMQEAERRMDNRINDLRKEIATREKIIKSRTKIVLDERLQAKKRLVEDLTEIRDEIFKPGPMSDAERLALWKKRALEKIDMYQERVDKKLFPSRAKSELPKFDTEALHIRFQLNDIHRKWMEMRAAEKVRQLKGIPKLVRFATQLSNTVRGIWTSFDLSATLRQGKLVLFSHPGISLRAIPDQIRAMASPERQFKIEEEIRERPNAPLYDQAKLELTALGGALNHQEEAFMSDWVSHIPGVAASGRGYTTFLNKLRADMFDTMAASLSRNGEPTLAEAKVIANAINVFTGRGPGLAGAEKMNAIFFAPRWTLSRLQYLTLQPLWGAGPWKGTYNARRLVAQEYLRQLIGATAYISLAALAMNAGIGNVSIETDARSSDFMKIRVGNTRVDVLAGLAQWMVLLWRIKTGEKKSSQGNIVPIRGENVPYGGDTVWDIMGRFGRSKFSPTVSLPVDILAGKDVVGQPVTMADLPRRVFIPLSYNDMLSTLKELGVPKGAAIEMLSVLGEGVQTYEEKTQGSTRRFPRPQQKF